ncbi:MAG: YhdH/YhfP family quinone oxidoreductase [Saprospiraceae bacterium]|nr:YhdH/YhfP family quinone oxidoreductase [Saprospiraceae bacterium]
MNIPYKALFISEQPNGEFQRTILERNTADLPAGSLLVRVKYSSLNYKDALSINGHKGITRNFPHQPGIDAVGEVIECHENRFQPGDKVIVCGYDLGMNTAGGLGQYIRVPSEWAVPLPNQLTMEEAMIYGTAGFTAAIALWQMERNLQHPDNGPIMVTGATGGVGSLAVAILSQAGYEVIASTGKQATATEFLKSLGANQIVGREAVNLDTDKLLLRSQWAGAIDTVGGNTLHTLLKACQPYGNVAACGLVQSPKLDLSVYPFIINGVNLLGVATAENPIEHKKMIWKKLAGEWAIPQLHAIKRVITLEQVSETVDQMMAGQSFGRVVVEL